MSPGATLIQYPRLIQPWLGILKCLSNWLTRNNAARAVETFSAKEKICWIRCGLISHERQKANIEAEGFFSAHPFQPPGPLPPMHHNNVISDAWMGGDL
ncbi:hypothetical protein ASE04_29570 [Rhizobium sp. Root708]|nr:hypothetical protein ASE04_29570 [Rhizobium sp. Root708]